MKRITLLVITVFSTLIALLSNNQVEAIDYYSTININDSLEDFSSDLTYLITSTHTYKSYGSGYNAPLAIGAAISTGSSSMELFYTGYIDSSNNSGGSTTNWNKEHVWPKSLVGGESSAPANDIHNIRPTNAQINSRRGNLAFNENFTTTIAYGAVPYADTSSYCYYNSSYFEPRDEVKGDCARIIFYLLTRYDSMNLNVSSVGDMDMLLRWHYDDPVDEYELNMNEACYDYQGNRNPYIDNPEYVDKMYPNDYGVSFEELEEISLVSETISNIVLPQKTGSYDINWSSSNQNVISNTGIVTQGTKDISVTLTASITKDGMVGTKEFIVVVKARVLSLTETFENIGMKNALKIDYQDYSNYEEVTTSTGSINNTSTFLNFESGTNYASTFGLDENEFVLEEYSKTQNYGAYFYKDETLSMYQGTVVKLSSINGNMSSIKVTYSNSSYGGVYLSNSESGGSELFSNVAQSVSTNEIYLIQNTTQGRITSIEITYTAAILSYDVFNIEYSVGFELSQSVYNQLSESSDFEIGLLYGYNIDDISNLYNNESLENFINNNNLIKSELSQSDLNSNYLFSANIIIEDLNTEVKSCAYMIYNDQIYFTQNLNRSTKDIISIYINEYNDDYLVKDYINLLKYILNS